MQHEQIKITYNLSPADYRGLCENVRSSIRLQLAILHDRIKDDHLTQSDLESSGWKIDLSDEDAGSMGTPQEKGKWTTYDWSPKSMVVREYDEDAVVTEMQVGDDQSAYEALLGFQAAIFDVDDFVYRAQSAAQPDN